MAITNVEIGHGLSLHFDRKPGEPAPTDVWLTFKSSRGKVAAISLGHYATQSGPVVGAALREWAADRILELTPKEVANDKAK